MEQINKPHVHTAYELSDEDRKLLDSWRHFAPHSDQSRRYVKINKTTRRLCAIILENCPPSRERSVAITHLENVRLWANNAIMKNEAKDGYQDDPDEETAGA